MIVTSLDISHNSCVWTGYGHHQDAHKWGQSPHMTRCTSFGNGGLSSTKDQAPEAWSTNARKFPEHNSAHSSGNKPDKHPKIWKGFGVGTGSYKVYTLICNVEGHYYHVGTLVCKDVHAHLWKMNISSQWAPCE